MGAPKDPLTRREHEVPRLIADSCTGREIAYVLVISEKTVERHRTNILMKLGLRDRVALTRYAIRRGLIEAELLTKEVGAWTDDARRRA